LRPDQDGHIVGYEGMHLLEHLSGWIIDAHLPPVGSRTQPVSAGYMANAFVRVKHPDYDQLRQMLDAIGQTVRPRAR
ncbi:MAG: ATPase, partial [Acidobacteriota bacterium]